MIKKIIAVFIMCCLALPAYSATSPQSLRDIIVVIDPGHGGKDPGATGKRGTREKRIVLDISKDLQQLINNQTGMHAVLTRKGDYYISLRKRLEIARHYNADIFVAVHADAGHNRKARGASVYALSERGASSEAARWMANKENHGEIGDIELDNHSNAVRSLLIGWSQKANRKRSLDLGSDVLNQLGVISKLHKKKVEQARFVVLKSPDIPSILVESGFLSNYTEEGKLRQVAYRQKIARAIFKGVQKYFNQYAPQDSLYYVDRKKGTLKYTVKKGDALSKIAKKYNITTGTLMRANKLESSLIRVGETLRVPRVA